MGRLKLWALRFALSEKERAALVDEKRLYALLRNEHGPDVDIYEPFTEAWRDARERVRGSFRQGDGE